MPWHFYLLEFVSGLLLTNGVPHFVQGVSGHRFQSPFAAPRGVGESSPLINVLWGFANLAAGFILLWLFGPYGFEPAVGWIVVGLGVLVAAVGMSVYFDTVRSKVP
jgi:hypothetical protein